MIRTPSPQRLYGGSGRRGRAASEAEGSDSGPRGAISNRYSPLSRSCPGSPCRPRAGRSAGIAESFQHGVELLVLDPCVELDPQRQVIGHLERESVERIDLRIQGVCPRSANTPIRTARMTRNRSRLETDVASRGDSHTSGWESNCEPVTPESDAT